MEANLVHPVALQETRVLGTRQMRFTAAEGRDILSLELKQQRIIQEEGGYRQRRAPI